jgi:predicted nucleic acid-binding protein
LDVLILSGVVELLPVSRAILIETAVLRQVSPDKLPDAIHIVTANSARCKFFMSHDDGMRVPKEMQRLKLDHVGVISVLEALRV